MTSSPRPTPPPPPVALPPAPSGRFLGTDLLAAACAVLLFVSGMWSMHGGAHALTQGWTPFWTSMADLTGLGASVGGLFGLVLVARPRSLERRYGLDRLFVWHRYLGETMAVLVG